MDEVKNTQKKSRTFTDLINLRIALIAMAIYAILFVAVGFVLANSFPGKFEDAGIFGDMYGAFNAFASGLAMLGVMGALLLQMEQTKMQGEELEAQRVELQLTRTELQGQKEAMKEQNAQSRRSFEAATMSDLMAEYDNMRDSIAELHAYFAANIDNHIDNFGNGLRHQHGSIKKVDAARFRVSRFFVRIRKLCSGSYLPESLVWHVLGRAAIEDVFLKMVDPLDQEVNRVNGKSEIHADKHFYEKLVQHYNSPSTGAA